MPRPDRKDFTVPIPPFFDLSISFGKEPHDRYAAELNKAVIALNKRTPVSINNPTINRLYTLKDRKNLRNEEKQLMRCKIGIIFLTDDKELRNKKLNETLQELRISPNKDDELWWYYGSLLQLKASLEQIFDDTLFKETVKCIKNIFSESHKKGLLCFLNNYSYSTLLNPSTIEEMAQQFGEDADYFSGAFAQKNHGHINDLLSTIPFFDIEQADQIIPNNEQGKKNIQTTLNMSVEANLRKMLAFYAHLRPLRISGIHFEIPNIPPELQARIDLDIVEALISDRTYNSDRVFSTSKKPPAIKIFETIKKILKRYDITLTKDYTENFFKSAINKEMTEKLELQSRLKGFNHIEAMALFHLCLSNAIKKDPSQIPIIKTDSVLSVVEHCKNKYQEIKEINDSSKTTPQKYSAYVASVKNLITNIIATKKSHVIAIGAPIKPGKTASKHAMYICLKYTEEAETPKIQIILVNGGDKISTFGKPYYLEGERKQYQYIAFDPIALSGKPLDALTEYLVYATTLEFMQAEADATNQTDDQGNIIGESPNTYDQLMKKLHDPHPTAFEGYLKRNDLSETFPAQLMGTCTIHNLIYTLNILFNMGISTFGYMLDLALIGLNEILNTHFSAEIKNMSAPPPPTPLPLLTI